MFSIQPSLSTTNPPPSLSSGLVQSPLLGYICDDDESSVRKETLLQWRQYRDASISHYPDASRGRVKKCPSKTINKVENVINEGLHGGIAVLQYV